MSLLKSVKKLAEKLNFELFQNLIINSFREILLILTGIFIIVILLMIFCFSGRVNTLKREQINFKDVEKQSIEQNSIKNSQFEYSTDILLTVNDFMMPDIDNFEISFDYIEFNPNKYYNLPKADIFNRDYEKIFSDYIEDSLKFDFEKRKAKVE
ncbi:MAG: hypothetical protein JXB50_13895 [Spirochaetes bacterium]|nr:hypothetical protein [Spirochaetota bacterium]